MIEAGLLEAQMTNSIVPIAVNQKTTQSQISINDPSFLFCNDFRHLCIIHYSLFRHIYIPLSNRMFNWLCAYIGNSNNFKFYGMMSNWHRFKE